MMMTMLTNHFKEQSDEDDDTMHLNIQTVCYSPSNHGSAENGSIQNGRFRNHSRQHSMNHDCGKRVLHPSISCGSVEPRPSFETRISTEAMRSERQNF